MARLLCFSIILLVSLPGCAETFEREADGGAEEDVSVYERVIQDEIPKIDIHTHYFHDRDYLIPILSNWNMKAVAVDVVAEGNSLREDWESMRLLREAHPDHILLATAFNSTNIDHPDFADTIITQLKENVEQGAVMVKVWKDVGMVIKDDSGEYIQIDDSRFQPIWDYMVEQDIPLMTHIGEPRAAWLPLDETDPHYTYYKNNPEYHNYNNEDVPTWETIIQARDRFLENNPDLTVIGAHLGSMAYDVSEVAKRLDEYPNFFVEPAERFGDLAVQSSEAVRRFFIEYQDRILYGTDLRARPSSSQLSNAQLQEEQAGIEERLEVHWEYLTSADSLTFVRTGSSFSARTRGLNLPRDVVERVYFENAAQLLDLPAFNHNR